MKIVPLFVTSLSFLVVGCTELVQVAPKSQPACSDDNPQSWVWVSNSKSELPAVEFELIALGAEIQRTMPQLGAIAFTSSSAITTFLQHDFNGQISLDSAVHLPDNPPAARFAINDVVPWGWDRIGVREAWLGGLGGSRGWGVRVALIDSGVDATHPDLQDALFVQVNFSSSCTGAMICSDDHGHGTHSAGIIASAENDLGTIGVSPDAKIYSAKSVDANGFGSLSGVLAALDWALVENTDLALLSPILSQPSSAACLAMHHTVAAGLPIIVPAGDVTAFSAAASPNGFALCDDAIVVSAIDEMDFVTPFSPMDPVIDLVAPGTYVVGPDLGGIWSVRSGTSKSAAFVTAAAALLIGRFPILTPAGLEGLLKDSATNLGDPGPDPVFGHGLIFPAAALRKALIGWEM